MSTVSYYTAEGLKKLRDELEQLKSIERPFFEYRERQLNIANFFAKHYSSVNLRFKEALDYVNCRTYSKMGFTILEVYVNE